MKFFQIKIFLLFLVIIALLVPFPVLAQNDSRTDIFEEIVNALNKETEEVFYNYSEIVDEFDNGDESTLLKFTNKLPVWKSVFNETKNVFSKYKSSFDSQISEISSLAIEANNKAQIAIGLYEKALISSGSDEFGNYIRDADKYFTEASDTHFRAVDLYNDYSGFSSSIYIKNWLVIFSVISGLFSILLLIKSKKKSQLEAEKIRAEVYKALLSSSLWMSGGLIVTTVGYSYALKEGGTYYILYGPIFIGGWKLLKGLYNYLTKGRKTLNYLNSIQKSEAIKESYTLSETKEKTPEYVCKYCGYKHSSKGVICKNCGENIL